MDTNKFVLDEKAGYFKNHGVDVMAFDDFYPAGHQYGVSILMHGKRVATNGDIRFEQTPGQWQPVPKLQERKLDVENNKIITSLSYPDMDTHLYGFNPIIYPDFEFNYKVTTEASGKDIIVTVDLDREVPKKYLGKLCFNLELFPGDLYGTPWIMDKKSGIFPTQPNGPVKEMPANFPNSLGIDSWKDGLQYKDGEAPNDVAALSRTSRQADGNRLANYMESYSPIVADDLIAEPYAVGHSFTVRPDDPESRFTVTSETGDLKLYDGRMNHNNGWFVLSTDVPEGKTEGAIKIVISPTIVESWIYAPVVQTSQVGYHPNQSKVAIVELDARDTDKHLAILVKYNADGEETVRSMIPIDFGKFLRYNYLKFDFSDVKEEGIYKIYYGKSESSVFRIAEDVYDRGVWQPVLEYFLPVQMCHMRVSEKYRVWHDLCHDDDARMAPVNFNGFDGYFQGPSTMTKYKPGEHVPGLNKGGWHDAGDFDLRVESQAGESYIMTLAYEEFGVNYDVTTIDEEKKITEIHQPDGKNDIQQQIAHGMLTVVGGYKALGRLYRGIICNDLRQYVLLGDSSAMTKNIPGDQDDRLVFTEDNPMREFTTAAQMAACYRSLKGFEDELAIDSLNAAKELYEVTNIPDDANDNMKARIIGAKLHAAAELYITTKEEKYKEYILSEIDFITEHIENTAWVACRVVHELNDAAFTEKLRAALVKLQEKIAKDSEETPYGIPYRPHIWGAGWMIQRMGFEYYFLYKAFPDIFPAELMYNALNFVLGCHPGSNTASFASGVGAKSATVAYGLNRADSSFIPGGVISGTALIRPDFPELLVWPYLWQQTEYVLGGGSGNYMFLVLAAQKILNNK